MAMEYTDENITTGYIDPRTPIKGLPHEFNFIRIDSNPDKCADVIVEYDGNKYAIYVDWEDDTHKALVVPDEFFCRRIPSREELARDQAEARLDMQRAELRIIRMQRFYRPDPDDGPTLRPIKPKLQTDITNFTVPIFGAILIALTVAIVAALTL